MAIFKYLSYATFILVILFMYAPKQYNHIVDSGKKVFTITKHYGGKVLNVTDTVINKTYDKVISDGKNKNSK